METSTLYDLARQQNIEVIPYPMPRCGSMSVMLEGGLCVVGIDPGLRDGGVRERVHLSHELGHCITGSFYNRYAAIDHRRRHENRADKWAIRRLIPAEDLAQAVADGHRELCDLAEHFGVTEEFMRKAVRFHRSGNLYIS